MGLFSNPRRDFLFRKTATFLAADGSEIATFNLVADHKKPDENLMIFLKTEGRENLYHPVGEKHLKEIVGYMETSLGDVSDEENRRLNFYGLVEFVIVSFIRGFAPFYRIDIKNKIGLHDCHFNEFGGMIVASDYYLGLGRTRYFYLMYTADEVTTLQRMSKRRLIEALRDLKEIYVSYVASNGKPS